MCVQEESLEKCPFPRKRKNSVGSAKRIYVEKRRRRRSKSRKEDNEKTEVRGHIGSDTSNPEATPQIPPSCWTSCSLHNRIRMNRLSPALSSPSPSCLLVYTLLALFGISLTSLLRLPSSSFLFCLLSLTLLSLLFHVYFILFLFVDFPSIFRVSLLPLARNGCSSILPFRSC